MRRSSYTTKPITSDKVRKGERARERENNKKMFAKANLFYLLGTLLLA